MSLPSSFHLQNWRRGRVDYLERVIQGNFKKISFSMAAFRKWAHAKGLKPSETGYKHGSQELRFSVSGDPSIEKEYRTHYVSPELSERKQELLKERLEKSPQPVAFQILRDSQCTECGTGLPRGSLLSMESQQPLCLACAGLGDLEFLPSGDTAVTRRSTKYSGRTVVVVRFSRSRGHYERQGILVEKAALEKAEIECAADSDQRAQARARAAERRKDDDRQLVARMVERLKELLPGCPPKEARAIAQHTAERGSGRVGRTAAGQNLDERAVTAAVVAAVRHRHTAYDELLMSGLDRAAARERVMDRVGGVLESWRESDSAASSLMSRSASS